MIFNSVRGYERFGWANMTGCSWRIADGMLMRILVLFGATMVCVINASDGPSIFAEFNSLRIRTNFAPGLGSQLRMRVRRIRNEVTFGRPWYRNPWIVHRSCVGSEPRAENLR